MMLQRQIKKEDEKLSCLPTAVPAATEEVLCKFLIGTPKETVRTVFILSQLAYYGFFDQKNNEEEQQVEEFINWNKKWKDPKIIFTKVDLTRCDIEVTADWDGYGSLKVTHTHQLPTDTITYNFTYLTIQEFLCAVYISTFPEKEQEHLLSEHYWCYPNVFIFLCGLTGLVSGTMLNLVFSKLSEYTDVVTAVKCLYESQQNSPPTNPIRLVISDNILLPYDCLCISYVLSCYPISNLIMDECHIGDRGAELLVKRYPLQNTTGQLLEVLNLNYNDLTIDGLIHIIMILRTSKPQCL